jgi:beta-glucosidase/6-phospho-beta-glucosidase/beta-galactosidase
MKIDHEGHIPKELINKLSASVSWKKMNYLFLDKTIGHMDFIGLNYYGVEKVKNIGITLDPTVEYSDSGRGISPNGLYEIIHKLNKRYAHKKLPYVITENGVADATDLTRPAYLVEHLKVIRKLMNEGTKFLGYVHWTLTDNFEWADGYCPKFGLVEMDRKTGTRHPRPSFYFYQDIIKKRAVSQQQIDWAWEQNIARARQDRPTCRAVDGVNSLDDYRFEKFKGIDWRFR